MSSRSGSGRLSSVSRLLRPPAVLIGRRRSLACTSSRGAGASVRIGGGGRGARRGWREVRWGLKVWWVREPYEFARRSLSRQVVVSWGPEEGKGDDLHVVRLDRRGEGPRQEGEEEESSHGETIERRVRR